MSPDVVALGEAMLRLSSKPGTPLDTATTLNVHVAGAEANVAVALSSLGRSVAWISSLPMGPLGRRVSRDLMAAGVNIDHVKWDEHGRIGTYFVESSAGPQGVSVIYDRRHSSFSKMGPDDLPWTEIGDARLVHVSGVTPALSDSCREATMILADTVRGSETLLSVDVNYRVRLWTAIEARKCVEQVAAAADLLICSGEDARDVFGLDGGVLQVAQSLADRMGVRHVVVTDGRKGAALYSDKESTFVDARSTAVVDRLGAGDAFAAGMIDGLLDSDVVGGLRRGTAMAAVALATRGDQVTITRDQLTALLVPGNRRLDR